MNAAHDILETVRSGRTDELPGLLKPLERAQHKVLLAELKQLRGELRASGWDRWQERDLMSPALVVAGAACHTGAAAAAAWIGARDLRRWQRPPTGALRDVLADRDPRWLADLAHRLAARSATVQQDYPLISELVRLAGCPMPTTDGCVEGWAAAVGASRTPLALALRRDPHVTALVPRLFETAEPVRVLAWRCDPDDPHHWPTALAALAEEGCVDRAVFLDGSTARLLRGGKPAQLKPYQAILQSLSPTEEEQRERAAVWVALTADAPSPVAGHAQQTLTRLAAAGHLAPRLLAEMSAAVLFRPEKKLVRAQLALLGKELSRNPAAAPELLPVLGEAFGHTDTDIQERALKLAAAHLTDDPVLRAELADQARLLSPAHRTRAVELFGPAATLTEDTGPYQEILQAGRLARRGRSARARHPPHRVGRAVRVQRSPRAPRAGHRGTPHRVAGVPGPVPRTGPGAQGIRTLLGRRGRRFTDRGPARGPGDPGRLVAPGRHGLRHQRGTRRGLRAAVARRGRRTRRPVPASRGGHRTRRPAPRGPAEGRGRAAHPRRPA